MDLILLLVILLIFMVPSFLMMRGQKKRQEQVELMRSSIVPGDRIVNVAGFHATVLENRGETMLVELAPGTVVTMETAGIVKKVEDTPVGELRGETEAEGHVGDPSEGHDGGSSRL